MVEEVLIEDVDSQENDNISTENLTKELDEYAKVAGEILENQEAQNTKKTLTNPSAMALTTTKHDAGEGLNRVKKNVRQLFNLYLTNQFIARAVNVKSDTIVTRGFKIIGDDKQGVSLCEELIRNSGKTNLIYQLSVNTFISGNGFFEKIYNEKRTKILRLKHVHPLTLDFKKKRDTDRIIIGANKEPVGYVQFYVDEKGVEVSKEVPKNRIAHFKFNTLGDEFTGLSLLQPGYDTTVRLMNMEYSAAESAIKIANPLIYVQCNTKSPNQVAQWGNILGNINGKDQIFIPEGMTIGTIAPGNQNFSEYAEYFLNAVVAATGVPKSVLLGDSGGSGNRAEGAILTRHFYSGVRRNQEYLSDFFYEIFKEYGKIANFTPPRLIFEDIAEDTSARTESAIELYAAGLIDRNEARKMIGLEEVSDKINVQQSIDKDVQKNELKKWHPEKPGSPAGSQKGNKKEAKLKQPSLV